MQGAGELVSLFAGLVVVQGVVLGVTTKVRRYRAEIGALHVVGAGVDSQKSRARVTSKPLYNGILRVRKVLNIDAASASTLTPQNHLLWIAAKPTNVFAHPLHRKTLV